MCALEVKALIHFFAGLVDGIVDFLQVNFENDVKARHCYLSC